MHKRLHGRWSGPRYFLMLERGLDAQIEHMMFEGGNARRIGPAFLEAFEERTQEFQVLPFRQTLEQSERLIRFFKG